MLNRRGFFGRRDRIRIYEEVDNESALTNAFNCLYPSASRIQQLLNNGEFVNHVNGNGMSALHLSVSHNWVEGAEMLLRAGANVNIQGIDNRTPLHFCTDTEESCPMIRKLLQYGADINAPDAQRKTPLFMAVASRAYLAVIELLEQGADTNACDENLTSPLMRSVLGLYARLRTTRALLNWGADPNLKDLEGFTPLHRQAMCGGASNQICKELLERGANPNARTSAGATPLHIAAKSSEIQMIRILLKYKAEVNVADYSGGTPLHLAAAHATRPVEVIELLIQSGALVDARDMDEKTPLFRAIERQRMEAMRELLHRNAAIDVMECFDAAYNSMFQGYKVYSKSSVQELIRYSLLHSATSWEDTRQKMLHYRMVGIMRECSVLAFNLEDYRDDCLKEVIEMGEERCPCGATSMWACVRGTNECECDGRNITLLCSLSKKHPLLMEALVHKLDKMFLLETVLNLLSYCRSDPPGRPGILNADCLLRMSDFVSSTQILTCLQLVWANGGASQIKKSIGCESIDPVVKNYEPRKKAKKSK